MAKPVILTVDDDPDVLRAVERDLRQRYDDRYRILRAESGIAALDLLRRLQQRNDSVALLLVDHRMPEMNGIETLVEAMKLYPDAKRVLLTAYADTEAAIKAINSVQLNHYLLKPWDPPDQQLYPVLDDLLDDWYADFRPPFEGVRVLGTRWSAKSYDVRNFLARNQVPYQWLDADTADREPEVKRLTREPEGRRAQVADGVLRRRQSLARTESSADCRKAGPAHPGRAGILRSGHPGRRTGGAGRGGVRRVGRIKDRNGRARSARRTGWA